MLDEVESFLERPTSKGKRIDGIIASVPPLKKQPFIDLGNRFMVPVFCEADVTTYSGNYFSSATMRFYPAIQKIKEILDTGTLGKVYTFTYHCGNNLYDWHPGTDMKTYYASTKEAGGCKEIFPFELGWMSMLFGTPIDAKGFIDKKLDDPDISADDVYTTTVKFNQATILSCMMESEIESCGEKYKVLIPRDSFQKNFTITGTILIDIVSRPAIRELRIVGEKGTLKWNWNDSFILFEPAEHHGLNVEQTLNGIKFTFDKGNAAEGYNSNICEEMYIEEMRNFTDSIQGKAEYYYPKEDEEACIRMLEKVTHV
jgi:predicted dehydrogenase